MIFITDYERHYGGNDFTTIKTHKFIRYDSPARYFQPFWDRLGVAVAGFNLAKIDLDIARAIPKQFWVLLPKGT